ncbi:hypothetical protein Ancab_014003 [Ancistrocladus abbreviatus]
MCQNYGKPIQKLRVDNVHASLVEHSMIVCIVNTLEENNHSLRSLQCLDVEPESRRHTMVLYRHNQRRAAREVANSVAQLSGSELEKFESKSYPNLAFEEGGSLIKLLQMQWGRHSISHTRPLLPSQQYSELMRICAAATAAALAGICGPHTHASQVTKQAGHHPPAWLLAGKQWTLARENIE